MPADPKLDEDRIANALSNPTVVLTPNGIRSLMSLVLMACYDRKVEREFMAEMIDVTAEVGILLSRMESGAKMRAAFSILKPGMEPTEIDEELQGLMRTWNAQRARVAMKFALLRQCPTTFDTIS
jgi:hypothetical protein